MKVDMPLDKKKNKKKKQTVQNLKKGNVYSVFGDPYIFG